MSEKSFKPKSKKPMKIKFKYKFIDVFTDGSAQDNGFRSCKGGSGVYWPNNEFKNISEQYINPNVTSPRTELYAVLRALEIIYESLYCKGKVVNLKQKYKLTIHTDCQYLINVFTKWINAWKAKGWKKADKKPVLNVDLISMIDRWFDLHKNDIIVEFKHVKSHRSPPRDKSSYEYYLWHGNDMADKLAKRSY